jgi:hypothetical protein
MSVQCPDLGVIVYLGMLAHYALPDKRPRQAKDLTPVLKDRSWPRLCENAKPKSRQCHSWRFVPPKSKSNEPTTARLIVDYASRAGGASFHTASARSGPSVYDPQAPRRLWITRIPALAILNSYLDKARQAAGRFGVSGQERGRMLKAWPRWLGLLAGLAALAAGLLVGSDPQEGWLLAARYTAWCKCRPANHSSRCLPAEGMKLAVKVSDTRAVAPGAVVRIHPDPVAPQVC